MDLKSALILAVIALSTTLCNAAPANPLAATADVEAAHSVNKRQLPVVLTGPIAGFGRPYGGIHAGNFGGIDGSPVFGPPLYGPFNDPFAREQRIKQLYDTNRRLSNKKPLRRYGDDYFYYSYGFPFDYYYL